MDDQQPETSRYWPGHEQQLESSGYRPGFASPLENCTRTGHRMRNLLWPSRPWSPFLLRINRTTRLPVLRRKRQSQEKDRLFCIYPETVRGIKAYMDWSFIPDRECTAQDNRQDNPWTGSNR